MSRQTRHAILATAGHVDHGKSALVQALTGTNPDRLPEEKARGMTIELGFAHLELPAPSPPAEGEQVVYDVGIIDVPGHEDFVRNMVAGVGSIDAALLVVAADDGWMPQTEEHLQILEYLGVSRGVVALTKADLVADVEAAAARVRDGLGGSALAAAPVVPTAAPSGRGVDELRAALASGLAAAPPPRDVGKPRLPLDRAFTLKGVGTIVTGTLAGGSLRRGQTVLVQPAGIRTRIRGLQTHGREVDLAVPGSRVALNLPDVQPAHGPAARGAPSVWRGDVVTVPELADTSDTLDVVVGRSPRAGRSDHPLRPLRSGTLVRFHHGSAAPAARLWFADTTELVGPGERALAQLRFEAPVFALAGDRFVLRDWSEQHTLAGGIVLDPHAPRGRLRTPHRRELMRRRADAPGDVAAFAATEVAGRLVVHADQLLRYTTFGSEEITTAVDRLEADGRVRRLGKWLGDPALGRDVLCRAADRIDAWHQAHPEQAGLPVAELRADLVRQVTDAGAVDAVLDELCRDGFVRAGTSIRRTAHRPALPPRLRAAGDRIRGVLADRPLDPPSRRQLAPGDADQQALRFLVLSGEVVELGPDVVISTDALASAAAATRDLIASRGPSTVSQIKSALGSSRRIVVPLLERLDRDGITRREGDRRRLV